MKEPRIRVAGILIEDDKILFIKHQKDNEKYWLLPGGGVDYGEDLQSSLEREFQEEVNIEIKVKELLFVSESIAPDLRRHIVNFFFLVEKESGEIKLGDEVILIDLKFLTLEEIEKEKLYPNIKNELKEFLKTKDKSIKYLGNRWE